MEGIQLLLIAQESGGTRRMHEMIEFPIRQIIGGIDAILKNAINTGAYSRASL
jgi:hypothetical protein